MDIKEYAAGGFVLYEGFAETVADISMEAIAASGLTGSMPHSQSRAKDVGRLHARLEEIGQGRRPTLRSCAKISPGAGWFSTRTAT